MDSTTVLLVDDEPFFLETLEKRMDLPGFHVLTAAGGKEGLAVLAERADVDVVLLDMQMPGMDGIQVLREIRRAYPLIVVIMLSGHTTIESARMGMALGAFDYLIKPCPVDQILARIREAKTQKTVQEQKINEARSL
ncbi:MAG: response regulator [Syntrophobacteraceae bacterium]|nr:response regulator [Desulfobacteraceae bacterium]